MSRLDLVSLLRTPGFRAWILGVGFKDWKFPNGTNARFADS